jgi:hypothetical protein
MTGSAPKPHQVPISVYSRVAPGITKYIISFMYLRAVLCTFQISVDFDFVPVGGRGGGRGGLEKWGGLEREGWNVYCMGWVHLVC